MVEVNASENVIALAAAIADGRDPDWDSADSAAADDAERELIRQLRTAARIGHNRVALYTSSLVGEVLGPQAAVESGARWGTLHILDKAGRGRFGDVYRAWDRTLDREVALKLLRRRRSSALSDDSDVIEEGRLMARIRHPNVATIYGAQTINGVTGLWMEFVRGRTLEAELASQGPFAANELVRVGVELCHALKAVHDAGLVHRDVKAQNVMRDDSGRVVLGDFGAGREVDAANGELAGTPVYVAPEIFNGEKATPRSDIYSLGVLLYHLATASFPVRASSVADLRDAHRRGLRTPLAAARPDLPPHVTAAIDCASASNPVVRFDSADALYSALSRSVASGRVVPRVRAGIVAAGVLSAVTALGWWTLESRTAAPAVPRWILVSAFDNKSGDPRLDHGLEVAFERELAQSHALSVVPHERIADTMRLMRLDTNAVIDASIARDICIRDGEIGLFVTGQIDRSGNSYELDVTVNDPKMGAPIVRTSVNITDLEHVIDAVRTVASRVRTGVGERRLQVERDLHLEQVTTSSLDALQAYTTGVAFMNEYRWAAAELPFQEAIRVDPGFTSAYIMLAHCLHKQFRPTGEYLPFAQRALQMSDGLPSRERYFVVGSYHVLAGDFAKAIPAFEALVREYPNDFWAVENLANAYHESGQYREEIPLIPRKAALRPNDFTLTVQLAGHLIVTGGDVAGARQLIDRAILLDPPTLPTPFTAIFVAYAHVFPAFELWSAGRIVDAAAHLDRIASDARTSDDLAAAIGMMNLSLGRIRAAEDAFKTMSLGSERQELLAAAAVARDDVAGARAIIRADARLLDPSQPDPARGVRGKQDFILWTILRAGLAHEAETYLARGVFDQDPTKWARAALAAAGGHRDAIPVLEAARKRLAPGNNQTLMAIEILGEALIQEGDLPGAEEVFLSIVGTRATTYNSSGSRGYLWLRIRARLLWLERQLGHDRQAQEIEGELRQLLEAADPECRDALLRMH